MRIALISDIHGNLFALEAVLRHIGREGVEGIYSLGDQVGMGPCPRQVMDCLRAEGIPCLVGNHESRVLRLRQGKDPELASAINYAAARWGMEQLDGVDLDLPLSFRVDTPAGSLLMVHAGLDDPFAWVRMQAPAAMDAVLEDQVARGVAFAHNHIQFVRVHQGKPGFVVGSVGMAENDIPGTATYAVLQADAQGFATQFHTVAYDPRPLRQAMIRSGAAQAYPIMARVVLESMTYCHETVPVFMDVALAQARFMGKPGLDAQAWEAAADRFAWRDAAIPWREYWR